MQAITAIWPVALPRSILRIGPFVQCTAVRSFTAPHAVAYSIPTSSFVGAIKKGVPHGS
ncbi:conserved hypothetical protein [Agrobacterium fabacearum CFBP 5771]|nr:conserved hypothetical protein [Agrobacterium fabacearum CFBP 5771]